MLICTNAKVVGRLNSHIVMLLLCRKIIAQLLTDAIEERAHAEVFCVYDFNSAVSAAMTRRPALALVEIPERNASPASDTLAVCAEIQRVSPGCKIILLCPENDKESVHVCVKEKKRGNIEDFLFYDSSVEYLASKIKAVCPCEEE